VQFRTDGFTRSDRRAGGGRRGYQWVHIPWNIKVLSLSSPLLFLAYRAVPSTASTPLCNIRATGSHARPGMAQRKRKLRIDHFYRRRTRDHSPGWPTFITFPESNNNGRCPVALWSLLLCAYWAHIITHRVRTLNNTSTCPVTWSARNVREKIYN